MEESLIIDIRQVHTFSWKDTLTIAEIIAKGLGAVAKDPVVKKVCQVLGVALHASTKVASGNISKYRCRAMYTRYTYVENISSACNSTTRYADYYGIENNAPNNVERARIYTDLPEVSFSQDRDHYYDFTLQAKDAYDYYHSYYV